MNTEKFTGKAEIYAKYRPSYPSVLFDYLREEIGVDTNSVVADIGAGTGIFTRLLAEKEGKVFAVEPNDDMRQTAEKSCGDFKNISFIDGTAENTTLANNSVDFITVAQAFHWFDSQNFKTECKRILKNGGKVIIVYNGREQKSPVIIETDAANRKYCPNFKGFEGGRGMRENEYSDFFKEGICVQQTFENSFLYTQNEFIGRNLSSSYAPKENEENYTPYIEELKHIFEKYAKNNRLLFSNLTKSYIGEV